MRYIGGKNRIAKHLVPIILETNPKYVIEPFCGALNVSVELIKLNPKLIVFASDIHSDLIQMWVAIQSGWLPPTSLDKEKYLELQNSESSILRTFAGYGCSFSGKWFGGYAEDNTGRNYCRNAYNSIIKIKPYLHNIVFMHSDYNNVDIRKDAVVYCDPPYAATTKPGTRSQFDHVAFWKWVEKLPIPCYTSEYVAPNNMKVVWQKEVKTDMHTTKGKDVRIEKLFWNGK